MKADHLGQFYRAERMREAVKEFLNEMNDQEALRAIYNGKDTKQFEGSKHVLRKAFETLEARYSEEKLTDKNKSR